MVSWVFYRHSHEASSGRINDSTKEQNAAGAILTDEENERMIRTEITRHSLRISLHAGCSGGFRPFLVYFHISLVNHVGKTQITSPSHAGKVRCAFESR